ncbi:MAG: WecB/TagA/CpsF family glycosyltransferase [Patescibacteria group bacterium]
MKTQRTPPKTQKLFNLSIFADTKAECYALLKEKLLVKNIVTRNPFTTTLRKPFIVFTPNSEQLMLAQHDHVFEQTLQKADLLLPDGVGVVWAGNMLNGNSTERISGRETLEFLISVAAKQSLPVFLLGGRESSSQYAQKLCARYIDNPEWNISWNAGVEDIKHETAEEKKNIATEIQYAKPKLLCIAYGAPYQERWVMKNLELLQKSGVRVVIVVGGAFDVLSGRVSLPPKWAVAIGVEWLWRLLRQPWRWRRQLVLPQFILRVLVEKMRG